MSSASTRDENRQAQALRVRELRTRLGLSQEQFAARLSVSYVTVSRWENGRSEMSAAVRRRLVQLEQPDPAPPPPAGSPPVPLSSFVGREPEIASLTALLSASRLVSLVGPGGAGTDEAGSRSPAPSAGRR
jgi:transcriptional regulator with XRE-family HTH domain